MCENTRKELRKYMREDESHMYGYDIPYEKYTKKTIFAIEVKKPANPRQC